MTRRTILGAAVAGVLAGWNSIAQEAAPDLGRIRARHARDIAGSNWSVGAETMDRDFTVYANWREYLGPLGVKKARIQSGWAKTEKVAGQYNWAWLDEIIPDMVRQGVEPWVCLSYGNPAYPDGGGTGLGGGLPRSPQALAGWDKFVAAFVERYQAQVREWEIWNEPNLRKANSAEDYAAFLIRTAGVIRGRQPTARILAMGMAGIDLAETDGVFKRLKEQGKLDLVNEVTYHPYAYNPDGSYAAVDKLRKLLAAYSAKIGIRQGENGAPSQRGSFGAIADRDWTEETQSKWTLRRLLGDLGRDIPSSYFSICDMHYPGRVNYKGLLAVNADKTVHHVKEAYRAVQHLTAVFDGSVERLADCPCTVSGIAPQTRHAAFAYRKKDVGMILALWRSGDEPGKRPEMENVRVQLGQGTFVAPVWADLRTGHVRAIPAAAVKTQGGGCVLDGIAVYDSPVLIAERKAIALQE